MQRSSYIWGGAAREEGGCRAAEFSKAAWIGSATHDPQIPLARWRRCERARRRTLAKDGLSGTVMKAIFQIECTPAEARAFFGLPDMEPMQAAVMERLQEHMVSEIDRFSSEALMNQWLSAFPENVERMQ